ncbi:HELICASE SKI2W [Salix purpurea]|uniref:HELICASE SKI2W n=1 Tax=Salix purpurea TaxID=77065 RepID=A0A9Q0PP28_SALPP|nr:HELICASE SKI2W [Salix purpurea]
MAKLPLEPSLPRSVVVPTWEVPFRRKKKGLVEGMWEPNSVQVDVSELSHGAQDSVHLPRVAGPAKDFLRGSINNRPFRPGGLEESQNVDRLLPDGATNGEWVWEVLNGGPAQAVAPSLKEGLDLGDLKAYPCTWNVYKDKGSLNNTSDEKLSELSVQFDDLFKKAWEEDDVAEYEGDAHLSEEDSTKSDAEVSQVDLSSSAARSELDALDEILFIESGALMPTSGGTSDSGGHQQKEQASAFTGSSEGIAEHFNQLVPDMALSFPFELDAFQKEAIYYLEKGDSVFVAAHTSAGKTVVAEYAFALASKHCTRAVYTAPIKTISNQKYRDFCGKFDVGLLTGDVSVRPEASCLIMTTEILRSMLYRGADIIRDIEWVIFDEVHYVNDVERGVVWEEVIIMLPRHVNILNLLTGSVGQSRRQSMLLELQKGRSLWSTAYFILENYTKYVKARDFMPQGLKTAKYAFKKNNSTAVGGSTGAYTGGNQNNGSGQNNWRSWRSEASLWLQLVNKLLKNSLLPVVIFCFSKNRCDKSADNRNLPQIVRVRSLLSRGIAVHHAGLLPIVKEVVEMLFCRGVIKVLFSTETFAMGVNAPARTVSVV